MPVNRTLSAAPDASGGSISGPPEPGATLSRPAELPPVPKLMAGKRGLVMGVANERSIAWGIAQALHGAGAEMAFTYQGAAFGKRVLPMVEKLGARIVQEADVENEESLDALFARLEKDWGRLDFVVHAIAFSDKEELKGRYVDTTKANFQKSLTISCYSFTEIARRALPLMTDGGSLITLTYEGAARVMPSYNVMGVAKAALEASVRYLAADLGPQGVRVNAISAGPMRTLAGAVIGSSRYVYRLSRETSPLRRNMELSDIGGAALYYLSDLSAGVTGTIHYVDGGYHAIGMPPASATGQNGEENGNGNEK
ncbi:MAG: Enoyl-[acyl-carrier-protein] reductase [NADH] [Enhydrobacter sp.]|jgi:enoyl-[acyl-carrier protein] reductase I|nr:MAG: Enoyl-[acyl-carrier-protein] reductase [NADH] [Enhydrobacter sp.]